MKADAAMRAGATFSSMAAFAVACSDDPAPLAILGALTFGVVVYCIWSKPEGDKA